MLSRPCSPCGTFFPSQSRLLRASRLFRFAPNPVLEPFGCGLPFLQDQRSPSALRAAEGGPISTLRLRASSTRMQAAVPAMRGRVFLSVAEDRAPKHMTLFCCEPVPETHAQLLDAFHPANPGS